MNPDQWNVDDELSRLKNEIKENKSQSRTTSHGEPIYHGPHQQIKGNNNVQVAGDLTFNARKAIDPRHPNAIRCPHCKDLTYRLSDWCTECNFNLHDYWIDLARKREKNQLTKIMLYCGVPGLLIMFLGTKFLTGTDALYPLSAVGVGLMAVAYLVSLRIDRI